MKKILSLISITLILSILLITGCSNKEEFDTNVTLIKPTSDITATQTAAVFSNQSGYFKVFDYESHNTAFLCNKPECSHDNNDCFAYTDAHLFFTQGDALYTISLIDASLYKRNLDGSNQDLVLKLVEKYNNNDNIVIPTSAVTQGNYLYVAFDMTSFDLEEGKEITTGIISRVDLNNNSEEILLELEDTQVSLTDYKNNQLYYMSYNSETSVNNNWGLMKYNIDNKTNEPFASDITKEYSYYSSLDDTLYFTKINSSIIDSLYSTTYDDTTLKEEKYLIKYKSEKGDVAYNPEIDKEVLIFPNEEYKETNLEDGTNLMFSTATPNGMIFSHSDGIINYYYITNEDFYNGNFDFMKFN